MKDNLDDSRLDPADVYTGHRVKEAREKFRLTQEELANDVGVNPKHISRIETGHKRGSDMLIRKISEVTDEPLSFFYGDAPVPENATDDERLLLLTLRKGHPMISAYDAKNLEGYQIKGTAEYVTEGKLVDTFKAMVEKMFNGAASAKGALIVTPEKAIVTTPGPDNKREL